MENEYVSHASLSLNKGISGDTQKMCVVGDEGKKAGWGGCR